MLSPIGSMRKDKTLKHSFAIMEVEYMIQQKKSSLILNLDVPALQVLHSISNQSGPQDGKNWVRLTC
jgi:hypothetical protein